MGKKHCKIPNKKSILIDWKSSQLMEKKSSHQWIVKSHYLYKKWEKF